MVAFDATEALTPCRDGKAYGAILFDRERLRQADIGLFDPQVWGARARPVDAGGRGSAWFVDAPFGAAVLRHYKRGGLMATLGRTNYLWRGARRTRSHAEFLLTRQLHDQGLPVPRPLAAMYLREGLLGYRAALLIERLDGVRPLADLAQEQGGHAPWEAVGRMIARFHRAGLDHVDLNAHNILVDGSGKAWLIDFDRCRLRIPATRWRQGNLDRLLRSLLKLRGVRTEEEVRADHARLCKAYELAWDRGI